MAEHLKQRGELRFRLKSVNLEDLHGLAEKDSVEEFRFPVGDMSGLVINAEP